MYDINVVNFTIYLARIDIGRYLLLFRLPVLLSLAIAYISKCSNSIFFHNISTVVTEQIIKVNE